MKLTKKLILASNSPRRKEILSNAGFDFEIIVRPTKEEFDPELDVSLVAEYLASKKIEEFKDLNEEIIIAADTVVILDNKILNKPQNHHEAHRMLSALSGKKHKVITGVAIKDSNNILSFSDETSVTFNELTRYEIDYYIEKHKPFDKAGAYGVQDFIGMIGINHIHGSFYTVMGLPIHLVYEHLKKHIIQ